MNSPEFKKLQSLLSAEKTLRETYEGYIKRMKDTSCDKHDLSFVNSGSRFHAWKAEISLTCYTGYYGNSSCSTEFPVPNDIAKALLSRVLQKRMREVLQWMAEEARLEAARIAKKAQSEIDAMQETLNSALAGAEGGAE